MSDVMDSTRRRSPANSPMTPVTREVEIKHDNESLKTKQPRLLRMLKRHSTSNNTVTTTAEISTPIKLSSDSSSKPKRQNMESFGSKKVKYVNFDIEKNDSEEEWKPSSKKKRGKLIKKIENKVEFKNEIIGRRRSSRAFSKIASARISGLLVEKGDSCDMYSNKQEQRRIELCEKIDMMTHDNVECGENEVNAEIEENLNLINDDEVKILDEGKVIKRKNKRQIKRKLKNKEVVKYKRKKETKQQEEEVIAEKTAILSLDDIENPEEKVTEKKEKPKLVIDFDASSEEDINTAEEKKQTKDKVNEKKPNIGEKKAETKNKQEESISISEKSLETLSEEIQHNTLKNDKCDDFIVDNDKDFKNVSNIELEKNDDNDEILMESELKENIVNENESNISNHEISYNSQREMIEDDEELSESMEEPKIVLPASFHLLKSDDKTIMEPSSEYLAQITDTPISVVPELIPVYKSGLNNVQDIIFMEMPLEPLNLDEFVFNLKMSDAISELEDEKTGESAEEFFKKLRKSVIVVERGEMNNSIIDAENFNTKDFIEKITAEDYHYDYDYGKESKLKVDKSVQSHSPTQDEVSSSLISSHEKCIDDILRDTDNIKYSPNEIQQSIIKLLPKKDKDKDNFIQSNSVQSINKKYSTFSYHSDISKNNKSNITSKRLMSDVSSSLIASEIQCQRRQRLDGNLKNFLWNANKSEIAPETSTKTTCAKSIASVPDQEKLNIIEEKDVICTVDEDK